MTGAQRDLLLALDFRAEGSPRCEPRAHRARWTGQAGEHADRGDMEIFLASDVIYSSASRH